MSRAASGRAATGARSSSAAYKVPVRVDVVAELPKSATGKLLKRVLREQAAASNPHSKD